MEKPVLVVLAAGMGSRYGGMKQLDPVGPGGQIIIDYSIFDAGAPVLKKSSSSSARRTRRPSGK